MRKLHPRRQNLLPYARGSRRQDAGATNHASHRTRVGSGGVLAPIPGGNARTSGIAADRIHGESAALFRSDRGVAGTGSHAPETAARHRASGIAGFWKQSAGGNAGAGAVSAVE